MPYDSIADAKSAGFPTSAEDIDLTLSQINKLAKLYDAIKAAGTADDPMAVAWTQWKKLYKKESGAWVENAGEYTVPDGFEPATLAFHQRSELNYTDDIDSGDTVFHDVIILAEGTWTDGHNRKPIHYSKNELSKMKIEKRTFKANHDIFGQLPITNEIGIIENEKFVTHPTPRWVGDVRVFPTQNGKDVITLLKRGAITDISSEVYSIHDKKDGKTHATDITFMGAASVRTGACSVCTFNEGEKSIQTDDNPTDERPLTQGVETMTEETIPAADSGADPSDEQKAVESALEAQNNEAESADIKLLESQLEDAKKMNGDKMAVELYAAGQKIATLEAENKELIRKVSTLEHGDRVKDLQRQINELNKTPVIHTRVETPSAGIGMTVSELDTGEFQQVAYSDME